MSSVVSEKKQNISDADILWYYLGITKIPIRINSPLRQDTKPSFGLFSFNGIDIFYKDFATQESGSTIQLFQKLWNLSYVDTWEKIVNDLKGGNNCNISKSHLPTNITITPKDKCNLQVITRSWKQWDIDYWKQFGITIEWLEYANVHPISQILFVKPYGTTTMPADKLAYAYAEFKEGVTSYKIYQPLNQNGFKWLNNHDGSVISLWTKIPKQGDYLVICSSLKDALCLWINTGIPAIAPQGEGYSLSDHAINDLKRQYKHIYILFDNDEPGLKAGQKLAERTNFQNIILPQFYGGKDVSDFYKILQNKQQFSKTIYKLIQYEIR